MQRVSGLLRIIGALALAAALASCSTIKLGYNAVDDLAYWWLDGFVSFNERQADKVRDDLDRLQAWHRANELPKVADLLGRMARMAQGAITADQACAFVPEIQQRMTAVAEQAEPAVVAAAQTLSTKQLFNLQRKYDKVDAKWRKDWIDAPLAEQRDKRYEQMLDRLEMVYGRLHDAQRASVRAAIDKSVFDAHRVLAERQRRQQDLVQVLSKLSAGHATAAEGRSAIKAYIERVVHSPDPAYRAYQQAQFDEGCRLVAALHDTTSPAQREHAVKRLHGWQRDLQELAAQR